MTTNEVPRDEDPGAAPDTPHRGRNQRGRPGHRFAGRDPSRDPSRRSSPTVSSSFVTSISTPKANSPSPRASVGSPGRIRHFRRASRARRCSISTHRRARRQPLAHRRDLRRASTDVLDPAGHRHPRVGGDTLWANTVAGYEDLRPSIRALANELRAVHTNGQDYGRVDVAKAKGRLRPEQLEHLKILRVHRLRDRTPGGPGPPRDRRARVAARRIRPAPRGPSLHRVGRTSSAPCSRM